MANERTQLELGTIEKLGFLAIAAGLLTTTFIRVLEIFPPGRCLALLHEPQMPDELLT